MRNILTKFRKSFLELKVRETWYLWLPWPNVSFIVVATFLVGQVTFRELLKFEGGRQIWLFILLVLLSVIKSSLIGLYTAKIDTIKSAKFNILSFICHLLPSFFFIWTFYFNWRSWSILLLILLDLGATFLSKWLINQKVQAHIIADVASILAICIFSFLEIDWSIGVIASISAVLLVTIRYLIVESFHNGFSLKVFYNSFSRKSVFSWREKSGQFYGFSELFSTLLFFIVLSEMLKALSQEISIVAVLAYIFSYYIFLYIRLFVYKQLGISYKELYYFVTLGSGILVYIWGINFIDISIVVWFLPAVIILVLDDFIYLGYQRYTNQVVELSLQGKQLFSKLKLFSLISLFIYNIISENEQRFLCYKIFGFTLNQNDNSIFRDYFLLPFLAILIAIIISIFILKIINSLLQSYSYLIDRKNNKVIKSMKYKFSRRLHKRK